MKYLILTCLVTMSASASAVTKNIIEILEDKGSFNTFLSALDQTGIKDTIREGKHLTVFAPTDDAFNNLPSDILNSILNDEKRLKSMLLYHVANPMLTKRIIAKMTGVKTLSGKFIINKSDNWRIRLNDSYLVDGNKFGTNGVVHFIDSVLIPGNKTPNNEIETVKSVDLEKYSGLWHELYRFPNNFERGCYDSTAKYTIKEKIIKVKNTCLLSNGMRKIANGTAFVVNRETNAELKVSFVPILQRWGFFAGDYNVLALDDNYDYALVGTKSREYLWILGRSNSISEEKVNELKQIAESQGYFVGKLIPTPNLKY